MLLLHFVKWRISVHLQKKTQLICTEQSGFPFWLDSDVMLCSLSVAQGHPTDRCALCWFGFLVRFSFSLFLSIRHLVVSEDCVLFEPCHKATVHQLWNLTPLLTARYVKQKHDRSLVPCGLHIFHSYSLVYRKGARSVRFIFISGCQKVFERKCALFDAVWSQVLAVIS